MARYHAGSLINGRILISHAARYLFVRVPKCANSTILGTLAQAEHASYGAVGAEPPQLDAKKAELVRGFARPSDLSARRAREVLAEYRLCMFVRNPFSRVASGYLHKVCNGGYTRHARLPADLSFLAFCEHLAAGGAWGDAHWLPQVDLCPVAPERLDFVGRFENLAPDLERMLVMLYGRTTALASREHHATGADQRLRHLFCERSLALVRDLFARDFAAFGYDPEQLPG